MVNASPNNPVEDHNIEEEEFLSEEVSNDLQNGVGICYLELESADYSSCSESSSELNTSDESSIPTEPFVHHPILPSRRHLFLRLRNSFEITPPPLTYQNAISNYVTSSSLRREGSYLFSVNHSGSMEAIEYYFDVPCDPQLIYNQESAAIDLTPLNSSENSVNTDDENPEDLDDENPEYPDDENPEDPDDEHPEDPDDENPEDSDDENPEDPDDTSSNNTYDESSSTSLIYQADYSEPCATSASINEPGHYLFTIDSRGNIVIIYRWSYSNNEAASSNIPARQQLCSNSRTNFYSSLETESVRGVTLIKSRVNHFGRAFHVRIQPSGNITVDTNLNRRHDDLSAHDSSVNNTSNSTHTLNQLEDTQYSMPIQPMDHYVYAEATYGGNENDSIPEDSLDETVLNMLRDENSTITDIRQFIESRERRANVNAFMTRELSQPGSGPNFANISIDIEQQQISQEPRNESYIEECTHIETYIKLKDGEDSPKCSVCLNEFNEGEMTRRLGCNHLFHDNCIDRWLESDLRCPNCRTDIRDSSE